MTLEHGAEPEGLEPEPAAAPEPPRSTPRSRPAEQPRGRLAPLAWAGALLLFVPLLAMCVATAEPQRPAITANPTGNPERATPIPTVAPTQAPAVYVVKPGDTLGAIADELNVPLNDLMTANRITDPTRLQVGDRLAIPGKTPPTAPTPPPATAANPSPAAGSPTPAGPAATATLQPAPPTGVRQVDGSDPMALVSKQTTLGPGYVPQDLQSVPVPVAVRPGIRLRSATLAAATELIDAAAAQGLRIAVVSGYRSYQEQDGLFNGYVAQMGRERAERISAVPGHSEHQLGNAIDFGSPSNNYQLEENFAQTAEGRWLAENGVRFGFLLSYPAGKEPVTGYAYEPWHWRYVGPDNAKAVAATGRTLTEYLATR